MEEHENRIKRKGINNTINKLKI